jgi:hypothetical protein
LYSRPNDLNPAEAEALATIVTLAIQQGGPWLQAYLVVKFGAAGAERFLSKIGVLPSPSEQEQSQGR